MSWVKLDDRIFDNPKIAALSDTAKVAYLESVCYCARELTDGFIPNKKALGLAGKPRIVQEITPHLWEIAPGGFMVHDYLKYNPTRAQVLAEREGAKRRKFGRSSGELSANFERTSGDGSGEVHPPPVDPVNPDIPPSSLVSPNPHPMPSPEEVLRQRPNIFRLYEHLFGKGVSALIADKLLDYERERPPECIEHCFQEAAEHNARTTTFLYRILDRHRNEGCLSVFSGAASPSVATIPRPSKRYAS